jgi:hypothetical protein
MKRAIRLVLLTALCCLSFNSVALSSVFSTDWPYLVDEDCNPLPRDHQWTGEPVYASGHHGWCSAPAGGPGTCNEQPLTIEELSINRHGCEFDEEGLWVRDGSCGSDPRFRYTGSLSTDHSYSVPIGRGGLVFLMAGDEIGVCPVGEPEIVETHERAIVSGYPRRTEVELQRDEVFIRAGTEFTTVEVFIPDIGRYSSHLDENNFWVTIPGTHTFETIFGGETAVVTVVVTVEHGINDEIDDETSERICVEHDWESVHVEIPGGFTTIEKSRGGNYERRPGPCSP